MGPRMSGTIKGNYGESSMSDSLNLVMLVAASIGALAFGILSAYAVLRVSFALMRPTRMKATVKVRPEVAGV